MFRYLVLGLLRDGTPRHGYALMKAYRERSGLTISSGNFSRELQRLARDALVTPVPNPDGSDPRRAPHLITAAGIAEFDAWMARPNRAEVGIYEDGLSMRALFVAEVPAAAGILDRWQQELWLTTKLLEDARDAALAADSAAPVARALARRLRHISADLAFLQQLRGVCPAVQPAAIATDPASRPPAASRAGPSAPRRGPSRRRGASDGNRTPAL